MIISRVHGVQGFAAAKRALAAILLLAGMASQARAQAGGQPIPPPAYFNAFPALYSGNYNAALATFQLMQQQSVKNPLVIASGGNWIDSICFQTMQGECYYELGQNAAALACYQNALTLYATFPDWMASVQFAPLIRPANLGQVQIAPWYVPQRGAVIGNYPQIVTIFQGRINNNQQVFNGGVVQMAQGVTICPQEIVRCTCLALRRWRELLGPTAPRHPLTQTVLNALVQRPALPNHWSEAYVDVELGLAYAAAGKNDMAAKALQAGAIALGQFDHPMTCTALLELGRLSLMAGNIPAAKTYFLEASTSACNFGQNFQQYGIIEEALRYGFLAHTLENRPTLYEPLAAAVTWATAQGLTQLQTSLLVMSAENFAQVERAKEAEAALSSATLLCAGNNILLGRLGSRLNYMKALCYYEQAKPAVAETALAAAMTFQAVGSLWLFHIGLVDTMWQANDLTDRSAMDLYEYVLRDPTPADWATDPLESLTVLVRPHASAFEHWFEVAITRKDHERALEISDLARRHRFLSTLELGGRLLNLRWVLEAPLQALDNEARQQRVALEGKYVGYVQRSRRAKELQAELRQAPLVPADEEAAEEQAGKLDELARLSVEQEVILREIALRREPCKLLFPPVRTTKEVQESLPKGHGLLAFFSTSRNAYAFLMTKDKYGYWAMKSSPKTFLRNVQSMLQKWGNYEQNKEMKREELDDDAWKEPARQILESLLADSKADLGDDMFQELAIVPDGLLWYVPFEALQVTVGDYTQPLISKVRIRYGPTVSLAVGESQKRRREGNTAVVLGKLFPRDEPEIATEAFNDLSRVVPGSVAIQGKLPAASAVYGSLFDRLVVYNEIPQGNEGPYAWSPMQLDRGAPGSSLASWFPLPWGGPEAVVLPGFRTSAERAAKGLSPEAAANEIFLSLCGLMSNGARTVLISRWRTGGQASYDLIREFVQELPDTTAADAWQRSIELVTRMPLDPTLEPRIKNDSQHEPPSAENPFFWAGYLLADTGSLPAGPDDEPEAPAVMPAAPADRPDAAAAGMPDGGVAAAGGGAAPGGPLVGGPLAGMPSEQGKNAGADDPALGGGLDLRRQPDPANPRAARTGRGGRPMLGGQGAGAMPQAPPDMAADAPLDGAGLNDPKKRLAKPKAERKKPAPRSKRGKTVVPVENE